MAYTQLAERFYNFANRECKGSSDLYEYLSLKIAHDAEMLELSSNAKEGQPVPNLFLGAVHYLLLKGNEHALKEFYPSMVQHPRKIKESFIPFKEFSNFYRDEIISILKNKIVQTNEVRRCAFLYPSFCYIYNIVNKPLSLIEIGTSAGLQLIWDKLVYTYDSIGMVGDEGSDVHITSEIKGANKPFLLPKSPPITFRYGLDLHINDVSNNEDTLWLNSLIWPEHNERRALFKQAVGVVKKYPINLIEGDGVTMLPDIANQIPENSVVCVFHTHVANQIPEEAKYKLLENIKMIGSKRDVFHLYNNMWDRKLHLDYIINGIEYNKIVGETDGHGRWFSWEL